MIELSSGSTFPHLPADFVSRGRLLALLETESAGRTVVVRAPGGFGKTALLADWARARGRVTWLRQKPASAEDKGVRAQVIAALEASRPPTRLVLDGVTQLDATSLRDLVDLVRHGPRRVRFVVAGRQVDVDDVEVSTVEAEQLAFTAGEAAALLAAWGVALDAGRLQRLQRRIGGCAAGLRFAALQLSRGEDPDQLLRVLGDVDGRSADRRDEWVPDAELLLMLSSHHSLAQIAERLDVPVAVARCRMHATYAALGASSRRGVVLAARERGLLG
jgi:LuxR family maltose regulon positive regulatory protein